MTDPRNLIALGGGHRTEYPVKALWLASRQDKSNHTSLNPTLPRFTVWGVVNVQTAGGNWWLESELIFTLNGKPVAHVPVNIKQATSPVATDLVITALVSAPPTTPDAMLIQAAGYPAQICAPHYLLANADQVTWNVSKATASAAVGFNFGLVIRQTT